MSTPAVSASRAASASSAATPCGNQFVDRIPVADDEAGEFPFVAQNFRERVVIGAGGHAGQSS